MAGAQRSPSRRPWPAWPAPAGSLDAGRRPGTHLLRRPPRPSSAGPAHTPTPASGRAAAAPACARGGEGRRVTRREVGAARRPSPCVGTRRRRPDAPLRAQTSGSGGRRPSGRVPRQAGGRARSLPASGSRGGRRPPLPSGRRLAPNSSAPAPPPGRGAGAPTRARRLAPSGWRRLDIEGVPPPPISFRPDVPNVRKGRPSSSLWKDFQRAFLAKPTISIG